MKIINRVVVLGAGTMGSGIAALFSNAGFEVCLLDVVPEKLSPDEEKKGLSLQDPLVRNRIVQDGFQRVKKSRPASIFTSDHSEKVNIGNLEDDFNWVSEADWIIEAVVENLEIKQNLFKRIEAVRKPGSVVSSNTSGISLEAISSDFSDDFKKHFLGVHFFNPPRYLKLVEMIPGKSTLPAVIKNICWVLEQRLGKGVVQAKDTPNFIANRIGQVSAAHLINFVIDNGYSVKEVDTLTGSIIGRPDTGTFRLLDMIGIDVWEATRKNLTSLLSSDEQIENVLNARKLNQLFEKMINLNLLGKKTRQGFYKEVLNETGKKEFYELDLQTCQYKPASKVEFESVKPIKILPEWKIRLEKLLEGEDRASVLVQNSLYHLLAYASNCVPGVTESPLFVDRALTWGFGHEGGPFEIWDFLGVQKTISRMIDLGYEPADWVNQMLSAGYNSFYQSDGMSKSGVYFPEKKKYEKIDYFRETINWQQEKFYKGIIQKNGSASLVNLGEDIWGLELHPALEVVDSGVLEFIDETLNQMEDQAAALVIGSGTRNFSAGTNLFMIASAAQEKNWKEIEDFVLLSQRVNQRIRYFAKPVILAVEGRAFGLGTEMILHASQVVASTELYAGMIDIAGGLLPSAGGVKEMLRRLVNPAMKFSSPDPVVYLQSLFEKIAFAKISSSAAEAVQMGLLEKKDRITYNSDNLLITAKKQAACLAQTGFVPELSQKIFAAGRDSLAVLRVAIYTLLKSQMITEYEGLLAEKLAYVLTGGDISQPSWMDEQYFLDLEKEAFLSLCGQPLTQERLWSLIKTGKPIRN